MGDSSSYRYAWTRVIWVTPVAILCMDQGDMGDSSSYRYAWTRVIWVTPVAIDMHGPG